MTKEAARLLLKSAIYQIASSLGINFARSLLDDAKVWLDNEQWKS